MTPLTVTVFTACSAANVNCLLILQTAQGEEVSGTSVEPQPESHIEEVPTRGKGRGKGRGKKSQPAINESMVRKIILHNRKNNYCSTLSLP